MPGYRFLPLAVLALVLHASPLQAEPACDPSIKLPTGFCATVFADHVGELRHMAMDANGDLYVALRKPSHGGSIAVLKDRDGDGRADGIRYFGDHDSGNGLALRGGWLYFATDTAVLRYRLTSGQAVPGDAPQTVVDGFPEQDQHSAKSIAFDGSGHLYVDVGAPSNSCQKQDRKAGSPGENPCPLLQEHGGIWRFDADKPNQHFPRDGERYATGIRNAVALTWGGASQGLYAAQMGRDQLQDNWPKLYSAQQSAELPAEELFAVQRGDDFGWPYCYYDQLQKKKVQAPEYGGDGKRPADCAKYAQPIAAFPGHWAPEALLFHSGRGFPARYRDGLFVSFHGSWNRAPLPQAGFRVTFVPLAGGKPGTYETFAEGFQAHGYRPMGLAEGPDGSLYIGDTERGRIWRVTYSASH